MSSKKSCGEPLSIEEIEAANLHADDGRVPHVPFGFANDMWLDFKSKIQPGDCIYDFSSAPETWAALAGRAGYVLVRDGEPVEQMITLMN